MFWILGFLTLVLVLDCLLLVLLILVQLPKKEAGLGQAFGTSTTDALFGAGSGNALTKMTKYATVVFFVLTLSLSLLQAHQSRERKDNLQRSLQKAAQEAPAAPIAKPPTPSQATPEGLLSAPATKPEAPAPAQTPANTGAATAPKPANPAPPAPPAAEKGK